MRPLKKKLSTLINRMVKLNLNSEKPNLRTWKFSQQAQKQREAIE